ncbi:unnamed protein product, partial [Prorocentrum cordatum]
EALPDLAPNQYGSHVLEAVLASWAERQAASPEAAAQLAPPLVAVCGALRERALLPLLVSDACASHAIRLLLLALGGYAAEMQGKGRASVRAGILPERKFDVPAEVAECRRGLAAAVVEMLRQDGGLALSARASPVVQLLLRILRDRGERALVAELAAVVVGAPAGSTKLSTERCDVLLHSAPGSRVLEAVLEAGPPELASALFSGYFRPRLGALARGEPEYGLPVAQRVADSLREEPQLRLALQEVDFVACLGAESSAAQHVLVARLLEACLRLRACLKEAAAAVFRAYGLQSSTEFHRAWPTLLALERTDSAPALLLAPKKQAAAEGPSLAEREALEGGGSVATAKLRTRSCAGSQILAALLRFPAETVRPLNEGLHKLLEHRQVLAAMAREARTARVLEAALTTTSALAPKPRLRLVKAFKGLLGTLGPHPVGGWVCASAWRASFGDEPLRKAFAEELLTVEDALRRDNFAVWKVCGLHQVKAHREVWEKGQKKAGKAKRFFDEILAGADPEAAKAASAAKAAAAAERAAQQEAAAALADPTVQRLLPVATVVEGAGAGPPRTGEDPEGDLGEPDADLDGCFSGAARSKKRRRAAPPQEPARAAAAPRREEAADPSLGEALRLIAAGSSKRGKRRKKASAKASA